MLIDIIDESTYLTSEQVALIETILQQTADYLGRSGQTEVDVSIVSNEAIQDLNRDYRGLDRPTDVLSFALTEVASEFDVDFSQVMEEEADSEDEKGMDDFAQHLGDIIISYPRAVEQAEDYGHSLERELAFLAVHGFLHLNGYDHQTDEEAEVMFGIQEEVLKSYGLTR